MKKFDQLRLKAIKPFRRFIKRNGRLSSNKSNIIYQLSLLFDSKLPRGIQRRIIQECVHTSNRDVVLKDYFQIDFFGRSYKETCIEALVRSRLEYTGAGKQKTPVFDNGSLNFIAIFTTGLLLTSVLLNSTSR